MERRRAIGLLGAVAGSQLVMPGDAFAELLAWGERVRESMALRDGGDASTAAGAPLPAASELTPARARVMAALADVIIPATDTPGAAEAGVTEFVAALVDGWLDDDDRDRFLAGLDTVDPAARERFGAIFAECTLGEQAALVSEFDEEVARLREDPAARATQHFFHNVKRFTLTAYFTSEVGLDALGYRTSYRAFEGCVTLPTTAGAPSPGSGPLSPAGGAS